MLTRLKSSLHDFLSSWLCVGVVAFAFFGMGTTFGWRAFVAVRQNFQLDDVVTWYGRGNGNIYQYYLSTLIVYSLLWLAGGLVLLLSSWVCNRAVSQGNRHPRRRN